MRRILIALGFCVFPVFAQAADTAQGCDSARTTRGIIVMSDGDLLRFTSPESFDYSADKGKTWKKLTTSGTWPTMDGRTLTVKDGKYISLEE